MIAAAVQTRCLISTSHSTSSAKTAQSIAIAFQRLSVAALLALVLFEIAMRE
jgi:hypothetical protein